MIYVLGLCLAWLVFRTGGVFTLDWSLAYAVAGLLAAVSAIWTSGEQPSRPHASLLILLGSLCALVILQVAPLPLALINTLSPVRGAELEALAGFSGPVRFPVLTNNLTLTVQRAIQLGALILVMLLVRNLTYATRRRPWAIVAPLLVIAGLEAVLGFVPHMVGNSAAAHGTFANRNHFAGLLAMCLPLALMCAIALVGRALLSWRVYAAMVLPPLLLLSIVFSLSRMGFLAALSALLITMLGFTLLRGRGWKKWGLVAAVGLLAVLFAVFLPTVELLDRFADLVQAGDLSANDRALIWADTRKLIADYPLTGCGLGAFEPSILRYQTVAPLMALNFAHNDYLQLLAELGWAGFALLLALFAWVFGAAVRGAGDHAGSEHGYVALGCCGAFTALLLHSFVDFNMYVPANAMAAAWIAGIALGLRSLPRARSQPGRQ